MSLPDNLPVKEGCATDLKIETLNKLEEAMSNLATMQSFLQECGRPLANAEDLYEQLKLIHKQVSAADCKLSKCAERKIRENERNYYDRYNRKSYTVQHKAFDLEDL